MQGEKGGTGGCVDRFKIAALILTRLAFKRHSRQSGGACIAHSGCKYACVCVCVMRPGDRICVYATRVLEREREREEIHPNLNARCFHCFRMHTHAHTHTQVFIPNGVGAPSPKPSRVSSVPVLSFLVNVYVHCGNFFYNSFEVLKCMTRFIP